MAKKVTLEITVKPGITSTALAMAIQAILFDYVDDVRVVKVGEDEK